jgi:hypothetical protein
MCWYGSYVVLGKVPSTIPEDGWSPTSRVPVYRLDRWLGDHYLQSLTRGLALWRCLLFCPPCENRLTTQFGCLLRCHVFSAALATFATESDSRRILAFFCHRFQIYTQRRVKINLNLHIALCIIAIGRKTLSGP